MHAFLQAHHWVFYVAALVILLLTYWLGRRDRRSANRVAVKRSGQGCVPFAHLRYYRDHTLPASADRTFTDRQLP